MFDLAKRDLTFGRNRKEKKAYEVRLQEEDALNLCTANFNYFVTIYATFLTNKEIKIVLYSLYAHIFL